MGGLPAAGELRGIAGAVAVRVPRNDAFLVVLDILEVFSQVFPGIDLLKAGFPRPIAAVQEAVVGPLRVVVFRHQINGAVIFAQFPVFRGNAFPGFGGIGFEHVFSQGQEGALLNVGPGIEPVSRGADQINGAVLRGQGQVVLGGPVCPDDPLDGQFSVDLFGQLFIEDLQHLIGLVGGDIAGYQIGNDDVLRGIRLGQYRHQRRHHQKRQEQGYELFHR